MCESLSDLGIENKEEYISLLCGEEGVKQNRTFQTREEVIAYLVGLGDALGYSSLMIIKLSFKEALDNFEVDDSLLCHDNVLVELG